jgi:hypothetical protein
MIATAMIINALRLKSTLINADNQQGSPLKRMKNTVYDPSTTTRRISFTQDNDMVNLTGNCKLKIKNAKTHDKLFFFLEYLLIK